MAKVKLNDGQFTVLQENIEKAKQAMTEAIDDIWQVNFENLYQNFVGNGFLDDLYKDAESSYHAIAGASGVGLGAAGAATCAAGAGLMGTSASAVIAAIPVIGSIPVAGWIIAGIICLVLIGIGIAHLVKAGTTPDWKYEARDIFVQLLEQCVGGVEPNYIAQENLQTKLENCKLSLQQILFAIAEFNSQFANLDEAAKEVGLGDKVQYADDGITVKDINTTINIDGTEVSTSVSGAMNAFFTYTSTVTAAEIEAEYLHQKYPDLDIDFAEIVKRANGFMTDTLNSGLYTKEFIDTLLPTYSVSLDDAKNSVTGATGLGLEGLETLLGKSGDLLGDIGLYAGLIGTSFIPLDKDKWPEDLIGDGAKDTNPPDTTGPEDTTPSGTSCGNKGCSSSGCSSRGCGGCGGATPTTPSTPTSPDTTPTTPVSTPDTEPSTEPGNNVEIENIDETKIPEEEYKFEYGMGDNVDYDKLAREAYEFGDGAEEIAKHQQELLEEIEKAYEDGNLDGLRAKLKEYGFSTPEIEAILADKYQCIKTMMYCDKREILAAKARELAAADGIKDYDTKFDDKIDYDKELSGEKPNDLLMLASEDETCVNAYKAMGEAKTAYEKAISDANPYITKANENKKVMEDLKKKYEKEFDSEDTTKWSEAAAKEYNDAIKTYNESAQAAATQIASVEAAKQVYTDARTAFETAENNYYEQIRNDQATQDNTNNVEDPANQNDGNNNNDNSDNQNNENQQVTELHTDNVVFDENGDVVFDMNNGQVQGASLDTSTLNLDSSVSVNDPAADTSKTTLDTSDIDHLIS